MNKNTKLEGYNLKSSNKNVNFKDFYSNSLLIKNQDDKRIYKVPENNQDTFSKLLFPNTSICRDTGYLCKIKENSTKELDRTSYKPKAYNNNLNVFIIKNN